jgi:hypothetical protein
MHISCELTPQQYLAHEEASRGVCLRCGSWSDGTDPGAANRKCGSCGSRFLFGVEQALLLGAVRIRR